MPIYEYKCSKCSAVFEALVRGDEKPACPECGSKRLKKLVSVFGVGTARKPRSKSCDAMAITFCSGTFLPSSTQRQYISLFAAQR